MNTVALLPNLVIIYIHVGVHPYLGLHSLAYNSLSMGVCGLCTVAESFIVFIGHPARLCCVACGD